MDAVAFTAGELIYRLLLVGAVEVEASYVGARVKRALAELEELDTRLILLIEEATELVRKLESEIPSAKWFTQEAGRLSRDLESFSEMAEERNYLLGLGWESEFTWPGRNRT